jgi:hypothetical protein
MPCIAYHEWHERRGRAECIQRGSNNARANDLAKAKVGFNDQEIAMPIFYDLGARIQTAFKQLLPIGWEARQPMGAYAHHVGEK